MGGTYFVCTPCDFCAIPPEPRSNYKNPPSLCKLVCGKGLGMLRLPPGDVSACVVVTYNYLGNLSISFQITVDIADIYKIRKILLYNFVYSAKFIIY